MTNLRQQGHEAGARVIPLRRWQVRPRLLLQFLNRVGVPLMVEFNERPWAASPLPTFLGKRLSLLDGISAAVAVSAWLVSRTSLETERFRRSVGVVEIPIIVDVREQEPAGNGYGSLCSFARPHQVTTVRWLSCSLPCGTCGSDTRRAGSS